MKTFTPETAAAFLADLATYRDCRAEEAALHAALCAGLRMLPAVYDVLEAEGERLRKTMPPNPNGGGLFNGGSWEPVARAVLAADATDPARQWVAAMDAARGVTA
jgi:hypothetical protein